MNELIELLKSRIGLDNQKAQSATQTVIDFLKQRFPGPVASQIESALSEGGIQGAIDSADLCCNGSQMQPSTAGATRHNPR
jgi:hypothetical protein